MGWTFYSLESLPDLYTIVWCKWPFRRLEPDRVARPVLVLAKEIMEDQTTQTQYGLLTVGFATGDLFEDTVGKLDLIVKDWNEIGRLKLHKPTRFSTDPAERRKLPRGDKYFVAPSYVRGANMVGGKLNQAQITRLTECIENRKK